MSYKTTRQFFVIFLLSASLGIALFAGQADAGGGIVLPATAKPLGQSLADVAEEFGLFFEAQNDLAFLPDTRFQILFVDRSTGTNTFHVKTGTKFFVPVSFVNDLPPILGDFPEDSSAVGEYFFSEQQLGGHDIEIEVDGQVTELGPEYAAGPVTIPGAVFGLEDFHHVQIGAFLTPLSKGTHIVKIRAIFDGDALEGGVFEFEIAYTVIVN
jgi:hypothetical protein